MALNISTKLRWLLVLTLTTWRVVLTLSSVAVALDDGPIEERTAFQTNALWSPRLNVDADVAMVYGIDRTMPARIESWRAQGYRIHVMTGVSWGHYADYLEGRFDGHVHDDQGQTEQNGQRIMHGIGHGIYYICPSDEFADYLCVGVKVALDNGAEAIHLEEPEFWARAGYSASFKRQWKEFYREDWQPPNSSVDAQYRSSKLKYVLFGRALSRVFRFIRDHNQSHHRSVRCYVPSHSLLNYAHWRIVSPESSLLGVGCDGFIAQVWTGTSRTPNVYAGQSKERTFETAYLEYATMQNLVRASGKRVWYLNDPIEDNPDRSWEDYRRNWENTLVASLLQPEVCRYEIMPWPERIFNGRYPPDDAALKIAAPLRVCVPISTAYETELQTVFRALGEIKQPAAATTWLKAGTQGVGVLVSDTMMFQRAEPMPSDPSLGSFYGLAMPLIKRGLPVQPVQIEFAGVKGSLAPYRMLLLTYEGQKPPGTELHEQLAAWVNSGGALVVIDDDRDPYLSVREWWNTGGNHYRSPREHLFKLLDLPANAEGTFAVGRGIVVRASLSPAALTYQKDGGDKLRAICKDAARRIGLPWLEASALVLRRGPLIVAAGLAESNESASSERLVGRFVNLFDPALAVLSRYDLLPNSRALLVDLNGMKADEPAIAAASCRTRGWRCAPERITFLSDGPVPSTAQILIPLKVAPKRVRIAGKPIAAEKASFSDGLLRLRFANSTTPTSVDIQR